MKYFFTVGGILLVIAFGWFIKVVVDRDNEREAICKRHSYVYVPSSKGISVCVDTGTGLTYLPDVLEKLDVKR